MTKYVLDTNLYIAANRSESGAEELIQFYSAFLRFTYLHAVVVQELLAGAVDAKRVRQVQEAYVAPFEARGRLITPSFRTWKRSGEVIATLVHRKLISPGGFGRSFVNDVLIAVSCREFGLTLMTRNVAHFQRIRQVERFELLTSWPVT